MQIFARKDIGIQNFLDFGFGFWNPNPNPKNPKIQKPNPNPKNPKNPKTKFKSKKSKNQIQKNPKFLDFLDSKIFKIVFFD
jgi:hypothetical protein